MITTKCERGTAKSAPRAVAVSPRAVVWSIHVERLQLADVRGVADTQRLSHVGKECILRGQR